MGLGRDVSIPFGSSSSGEEITLYGYEERILTRLISYCGSFFLAIHLNEHVSQFLSFRLCEYYYFVKSIENVSV